ncbi:MAG: PAS domain S-box protein, partial [Methanobacteriota archaeon]
MNKQIQVLMVEDDAVDRMAFDRMITAEHPGFLVTFASSFHAAQALLSQQQFDVIVSDFDLGDGDALEVLKIAEDIPVIVVTGAGSEERAVQAMKAGAYDYIVKDTERRYLTLLPLTIENVLKARTAEAQFRMFAHALGSLADSVYICDGNGEIFYVNDAFLERFGYLREEILGQSLEKLLAPENSANLFQDILQKTASGGWQGEVNCLRKDGTPVLVFLSTLPAFNHSHQLLSFSGSIKDISQRKKVEKAFISSTTEEQSISLLMVEDDLVDQMAFKRVVKNEALPYDYTMANCVEEAVLKIESREFDVIVTDYSLGDGNALDILKVAKDIPVIIITGAGDEEIAVEAMKAGAYDYLIKDPHRNYLKTLPLTIKHAINSKASERRFKMLSHALMSINDSVWITDLQDNILFVNEAFLKNYGYEDISEIIGKSIHIVHSESTSAETIQNIQLETMCGGWDGELMSRRKDGSEFPIYLSTSIIYDDNGLPLAFTGVAKDITEQKQAQEELRKAKESAEAANRAKSEFLANVSHEIRTPMNGILGMTELALDTNLDPEQREYLSMVKSSAESLLSIINDILDFSKIEAGKFELRPVEFNLAQNLAELMKPLTLRARQKGVELNYDLASGIPENLIGDPVRLRQIIVNLIGNAIKFTDKGHISFDVTPEWQRDQKICLHFQVKDTGIGVPPEKQD